MLHSSWIPNVSPNSEFSLQNLPFGVFSPITTTTTSTSTSSSSSPSGSFHSPLFRHCATIVGDTVIDLSVLEEALLLNITTTTTTTFDDTVLFVGETTLNKFLSQPKSIWTAVRNCLLHLLAENGEDSRLRENTNLCQAAFYHVDQVQMYLPITIGEYTDFYSSQEHATNVGMLFRSKENPLLPNWLHLPVGYHGRASTIVVSGHEFHRPWGQVPVNRKDLSQGSHFVPTQCLDFELEIGTIVGGPPNALGQPLTLQQAQDRIFGFVLLNDWSARDIQKFEYVPLGPFTSKHFATTISPWIVTTDALEPFQITPDPIPQTDPIPHSYLRDVTTTTTSTNTKNPGGGGCWYDVNLTVAIQPQPDQQDEASGIDDTNTMDNKDTTSPSPPAPSSYIVCRSNLKHLYWNFAQQLVHHTVTGCIMQPGDILGTGTLSGSTPGSYGSLLELSWNGTRDVFLVNEEEEEEHKNQETLSQSLDRAKMNRKHFLQDGDCVILRGCASQRNDGVVVGRVGFGECKATILPPLKEKGESQVMDDTERLQQLEPKVSQERYTKVKLYGFWRSSSTWRVRIALQAKKIQYETIPINLHQKEHKKPEYLQMNPLGQVPMLEVYDTETQQVIRLTQSSAIIEFLEDAFPHRPSLFPRDSSSSNNSHSYTKALARQMVEVINSGTQPLQNQFFLSRLEELSEGKIKMIQEAKRINEIGLTALESLVVCQREQEQQHDPSHKQESALFVVVDGPSSSSSSFCMRTISPTIVDVYMVPQLANARRFGVNVNEICPTLVKINAICCKHAWFQGTEPEAQPDAPIVP